MPLNLPHMSRYSMQEQSFKMCSENYLSPLRVLIQGCFLVDQKMKFENPKNPKVAHNWRKNHTNGL